MRSEQRFRQLYDHSTAAILTVRPDGRIVECNGLACRLLMRGRDEIVGSMLDGWLSGADRGATMRHLRAAFEGTTSDWYASVPRIEGARRQVIARMVPDTRDTIELVHVLIVTPVQAGSIGGGEALRPLLENLPNQFALLLDADYRIRYATGLARTHWLNAEDVLGSGLMQLLEPVDAVSAQLAEMRKEVEAGRAWACQQLHRRADGSSIRVDVYALPHRDPASGEIVGALYAGRDVSAEHELRVRSERADRFAVIGDVVVSVAAELQRALGRVHECAAGTAGGAAIMPALQSASELVEKLLAFASVRPLERSDVELEAAIRHALALLQDEVAAAGITVTTRISSEIPALRLDEGHLTRLVRELVQNGIDAMGAPGVVEKSLRIVASREGDHVILAVEDRGPGIPAMVGDRVFEPFYTTKQGRLGLGLSIVRGIVAAHDGRVSLRSMPTGGARALVRLPIRAAGPRARFRVAPLVLRSRSVLLVEDDESVRRVIRKALEATGYRVSEAFSGRSALSKLTTGEVPDLIITDLKMGGGNGYWLIDKLRTDFPRLHARTLIITGDAAVDRLDQIERATGCTVLAKPVSFPTLLEAMEDLLLRTADAGPRR